MQVHFRAEKFFRFEKKAPVMKRMTFGVVCHGRSAAMTPPLVYVYVCFEYVCHALLYHLHSMRDAL